MTFHLNILVFDYMNGEQRKGKVKQNLLSSVKLFL